MDEFETYEDVIDAYNANDMGYSTLTDYIKGQNIKIKEISMEPLADLQRSLFENKADGGMIGIEVLFRDKKADGGRVPMVSGGALKGLMSLFKGGDKAADLAKQEEIFRTGPITTKFLEDVDNKVIDKFIRTRDTKGPGGYGMYDNFDDMPAGLKAAELISRIKKPGGGIDYERAEIFIGKKLKGDETIDELIDMVISEPIGSGKSANLEELMADGGRVGLFMGGPALEGTALNIYNSMNAYGFTDQEIADALSARGLYTPAGSGTTTQPEQVTGIINQQLQTGGGDGPQGNFGIFGDLDKSTAKEFNVEVYDEELGDFIPTTITGYQNVKSGLYQDKFGKNLQPMFSNTGLTPGFLGAALSLVGMKPQTVGGFVPGSIRGKFDGIRDIFNKQKKQQEDIIKQQQEKAKKEREARAAIAAAEMQQRNRDNKTGGYQSSFAQDRDFMEGPGGGRPGGGGYGGGADLSSTMGSFKRGGLATMFTRRR